jgi:O-antigen/teichoic acid export membrane protein
VRFTSEWLEQHRGLLWLGAFFGVKVLAGLALLKMSAELLPVDGFALFSQFLMLWALLNLVASGGVQNGLIRQIANAESDVAARTALRAGVRIWGGASLAVLSLILLREGVSVTLTGSAASAWMVPWLVLAAIVAGLGQLFSAVLIGSGRLSANVCSQTVGLVAGLGAAAACLYRAEAEWSVIAFAGGSLLTPATGWFLARKLPAVSFGPANALKPETRALLGFSGAFIAVAVVTPTVLFALRHFYREAFGVDALSDWLVANRISDVSTQLIGLFLVQWYLPTISAPGRGASENRTTSLTAFVVGSAVMGLVLATFLIGAPILVPLFLSDQYMSASTPIAMYMLGDVLRVTVSVAMFHALARRRLWAYLGFEVLTASLIGILVGIGIRQGHVDAPYIGYVAAYAVVFAVICIHFLLTSRRGDDDVPATAKTGAPGTSDRPSVLLVFAKYGDSVGTRYLTNDLADAFVERGYRVRVIHIPWDTSGDRAETFYVQENGIEVLVSPPISLGWLGRLGALFAKWGGSSLVAAHRGKRRFGTSPGDIVIGMSPLVVGTFVWRWALKSAHVRSYAYLVDFFPFHHHAIGVMPGGMIFRLAHWLECALLRRFTVVGCMSPRGHDYLARRYALRPEQATGVIPLWGEQSTAASVDPRRARAAYRLPPDVPVAVFGGQITYGRGIEDILVCAELARNAGPNLIFLFIGSGPLAPLVQQAIDGGATNVRLVDEVGRDDYLALIAACDVGIVATVANVDVPTFPSKTIDYLRAGLPVAASVEASTDFDAFVEAQGFGLAVAAGRPDRLLDAIASIVGDQDRRRAMVLAGRRTLQEVFNVDVAVAAMLDQIGEAHQRKSSSLRGRPAPAKFSEKK